ncbi:MAG: Two component regulator three Y domain-containing protein [Bacteroidota bacterium]
MYLRLLNKISALLWLFVLLPIWALSQNLLPPISNYRTFDYGAASKNWSLSVSDNGELFTANNKGLLHYNGEEWQLYQLPNKTTIRSVASIRDRIYTGSYEEFGYWTRTAEGPLEYTSLTHLIKDHEFTSEEFWQILPHQDVIIFRSFAGIYLYKDDHIKVVKPPFVITHMTVFRDRVFLAGGHEGLYWLSDDELLTHGKHPLLDRKVVVDMDVVDDELLISTKLNGCFTLGTDDQLSIYETKVNASLKQHQLNQALPLADGRIAFGTIKGGIYFYDPVNDSFKRLNRQLGLQNNTVLSMLQYEDQLWVGLDNGIDRLQLNNPLTYYTDYSGVVGTVYDLAIHNEVVYLGSNTGVYYFEEDQLKFVEGTQGHVWDLEVLEGELLCGHNTGTFKIENDQLSRVSDISGGYQIIKVPESSGTFLQGTYTGIAKYSKEAEGDWTVRAIPGIGFPVKYLCFENQNTLWVAHPYKGLYRVQLDEGLNTVMKSEEFRDDVIPNIYNVRVYNIKNQIVLLSEGKWYKYDPILGKIEPFQEFQAYNNKNLVHFDEEHYWFIDNDATREVIYTNLKGERLILDDAQLKRRLAEEAEKIVQLNDSVYYFTLTDGFGRLNRSQFKEYLNTFVLPAPELNSFQDKAGPHSIMDSSFAVPYKRSRDLSLKFAAASVVRPRYFYKLKGSIQDSAYMDTGTLNFQNLPFGDYTLAVYTVGIDNERSAPKVVSFEIAPPWYLSNWSVLCYFLGILGVFFLVRHYNRQKLEKRHLKLKEKLQREQKEHLARLEKEKLAKEVKLKQKELASTTMNVAKKNELILELKNLLLMNKDKFSNQQRYRAFIKKLNSSINDDDDWQRFEVNFKELHEDFFEVLLDRYPSLTPKDLKLSAYLKMNLSSKEIAPLMGISTRGVEIHRYRLRKKLAIDASQNISNFLITLK